jgi:hypothetical protein
VSRRIILPHAWDYRSAKVETGAKVPLSPTQLENHTVSRARMALIAGVDLALLAANKLVLPSAVLTKAGARYQDDQGDKKAKTCAAHALPCGIKINNATPDKLPALHGRPSLQEFIIEPYRYTNVVPVTVNLADLRAEAYNRTDGTGLVANFVTFCAKLLSAVPNPSGKLNRASLQLEFKAYIEACQNSFLLAQSRDAPIQPHRFSEFIVPKDSEEDARQDNIRTALRAQERTLRELGPSLYSTILVEQVESDFHSADK